MKRVAVFGNAGGGKSTLARRLAELTRLPLFSIDMMQFKAGGDKVPDEEYLRQHADILRRDEWIIDGFDSVASAWERFAAADTLIYVDLPLVTHYWWVTSASSRDSTPSRRAGRTRARCGAARSAAIA
jgi:adenylate kinase family enzyme